MAWTAYHLAPIDFGWEHLPDASEVAAKLAKTDVEELIMTRCIGKGTSLSQFSANLAKAFELAKAEGWEGDIKGGEPSVIWLPTELEFMYAFVWKQSNNGSTFVVSPVPIPWLDGL